MLELEGCRWAHDLAQVGVVTAEQVVTGEPDVLLPAAAASVLDRGGCRLLLRTAQRPVQACMPIWSSSTNATRPPRSTSCSKSSKPVADLPTPGGPYNQSHATVTGQASPTQRGPGNRQDSSSASRDAHMRRLGAHTTRRGAVPVTWKGLTTLQDSGDTALIQGRGESAHSSNAPSTEDLDDQRWSAETNSSQSRKGLRMMVLD
jgi:hypothetical protein